MNYSLCDAYSVSKCVLMVHAFIKFVLNTCKTFTLQENLSICNSLAIDGCIRYHNKDKNIALKTARFLNSQCGSVATLINIFKLMIIRNDQILVFESPQTIFV